MKNSIFNRLISVILVVSMLLSFSVFFASAKEEKTGTVTTTIRVRTGPGTDNEQLVYNNEKVALYANDAVTIISEHESSNDDVNNPLWYKVSFFKGTKNLTGYVSADYVVVNKPITDIIMPDGVPELYKPYIEQLLANHPDWNFVFYDTGLEWADLFTEDAEGYLGRSVIQYTFPLSYRSTQSGAYSFRNDKWYCPGNETGWYQANEQTIAYYMDPRNFLNEVNVFMFEALSYDKETQTFDGVKKIVEGSFMDGVFIKANNGIKISYAKSYINAAVNSGVSPYHLASRTIQEVGKNGSGSTSGKYIAKNGKDYSGYYNFYNIGAYAGSDPIANGLRYASGKDSKGETLPQETLTKYMLPWNTPYRAIIGGAKWIGAGYINNKQDTLYFQKFNVINQVWGHQYMANIMAPASESVRIRNTYSSLGILDQSFTFLVPYYHNMPKNACELPKSSNASPNNWLSSLSVSGVDMNFDGAKTTYNFNVKSSVSKITVNATPVNAKATVTGTGEFHLKEGLNTINIVVKAENGDKRTYKLHVTRIDGENIPITSISLNKDSLNMFIQDKTRLKVSFEPSNTTEDTTVKWTTSNKSVATVSSKGLVTALSSGTTIITAQVGDFTAECEVIVTDDVVKGDVDADNAVTIADALMIFKFKSSEITLSETAKLAADTDGNSTVELADALRIFKFKSGEIKEL